MSAPTKVEKDNEYISNLNPQGQPKTIQEDLASLKAEMSEEKMKIAALQASDARQRQKLVEMKASIAQLFHHFDDMRDSIIDLDHDLEKVREKFDRVADENQEIRNMILEGLDSTDLRQQNLASEDSGDDWRVGDGQINDADDYYWNVGDEQLDVSNAEIMGLLESLQKDAIGLQASEAKQRADLQEDTTFLDQRITALEVSNEQQFDALENLDDRIHTLVKGTL